MARQANPHVPSQFQQSGPAILAAADAVSRAKSPTREVAAIANSVIEEAEVLHGSLKAGSMAQIVVAIIATIGLFYLLKFVIVTILVALLLAFILEPMVHQLCRVRIPRAIGAFLAVALTAGCVGWIGYFLCYRLGDFVLELSKDSNRIQQVLTQIEEPVKNLERTVSSVRRSPQDSSGPVTVQIQEAPAVSRIVASNSAAIGELLLALGFIPFLTYFMLTWKEHAHSATVALFPEEHRAVAYRTMARISWMIRSFMVGNLTVALIGAGVFSSVFWLLKIPYFYFLGILSGFANLIPTFGLWLALLPPLAGGIGFLSRTGVVALLVAVIGAHVTIMNVLYPKLIGKRVRLNPLAVVLSLLFWSWIWGAIGLILAVPIAGTVKIVCDYVDSLRGIGAWLGD